MGGGVLDFNMNLTDENNVKQYLLTRLKSWRSILLENGGKNCNKTGKKTIAIIKQTVLSTKITGVILKRM